MIFRLGFLAALVTSAMAALYEYEDGVSVFDCTDMPKQNQAHTKMQMLSCLDRGRGCNPSRLQ